MADRADAAGSDPSGRPAATLQEEEGKQRARRVAPLPLLDAVVPAKPHRAGGWCPSPSVCPPSMSQQAITWSTNTLRPNVRPGQAVSKLGFRFVWTAHHRVGADLEPFRRVGDELADAVLDAVSIPPKTDSLEIIRAAAADSMHPAHAPAQALLEQTTRDPVWLDRAQLARGQEVLIRYGVGSLSMLFYFSLVGGFGAPQINKVLTSTGYLNNKHTLRRLLETTQMVTDCLDPQSLEPFAQGWSSCLRVRMLHAKVRQRLRRMKKWDSAAWGVPINQEDMCATQLSFCFNVLLGLKHMHVHVTPQECEDYTHMWRYMGHILGVVPEMNPCESFRRSQAYMESIFMHLVQPDATSVRLSQNCLRSVASQPPVYLPYGVNAQLSRMLLGDAMADKLELPPNNVAYYYLHMLGFAMFVRLPAWLSRWPVIGPVVMARQLLGMKNMVKVGLGGVRTSFHMSHAPKGVRHGTEEAPVRGADFESPPWTTGMVWLVVKRALLCLALAIALSRLGARGGRWLLSWLRVLGWGQRVGSVTR